MTKKIFEILGIKPDEIKKLKVFLLYSLGTGISISFLFALASSLFIAHYRIEDLPLVYIIGGAIGYVINVFLSLSYTKIGFKKTSYFVLGLVTIVLSIFTYFLISGNYEKIVVYWLYISTIPIVILLTSSVNGSMVRHLDLEQNKRLSGIINSGEIIASILSYFSIPILIKLIGTQSFLLLFAIIGCIIAFIAYMKLDSISATSKVSFKNRPAENLPYSTKYFWLVFILILLSGTMAFIVNYEFLGVLSDAKNLYSEEWVLSFLGIFFGITQCVEFFISFLSGKILTRYGINLGIKIIPFLLVLLCIGSLIAFLSQSFWSYFVLVMLVKFFERIFRTTIERPATTVLYQIFSKYKLRVQQFMDGQVQNLTSVTSGLILLLVIFGFNDDSTLLFNFTWSALSVIWLIVSLIIIVGFRKRLQSIVSNKQETNEDKTTNFKINGVFGYRITKPILVVQNTSFFNHRNSVLQSDKKVEVESIQGRLKFLLEINRYLSTTPFYENLKPTINLEIKSDLIKLSELFSSKLNLDEAFINLFDQTPNEVKIFSLELINNFTDLKSRIYIQSIFSLFDTNTMGNIGLRKDLNKKYRFSQIMRKLIEGNQFSTILRYKAILAFGENYVINVPSVIRNAVNSHAPLIAAAAKYVVAKDKGKDFYDDNLERFETISNHGFYEKIPIQSINDLNNLKLNHSNTINNVSHQFLLSGFINVIPKDNNGLMNLNLGLIELEHTEIKSIENAEILSAEIKESK